MGYQTIKKREDLSSMCEEYGVSLPYAEDVSILNTKWEITASKSAPNRIAYQAMEGCDGTADGSPGELTVRRYDRFAKGGPGIIWFEATAVMEEGRANPRQLYLHEGTLPDFAREVERIKTTCLQENGYEPLVICQLTHSGRYSKPHGTPAPRIAYNNPLFEKDMPLPEASIVSDEELDRTGEKLIEGAALARRAGFDGADIKCCHRYLLCELLSAFSRKGKYGGSFENRTRLLRESITGALQTSGGEDFIITSRLNIYDGFPYPYGFGVREGEGITPCYDEATRLVGLLVELGLPLLNVTMGNPYVNPHVNRPFATGSYDPGEHPIEGVARMLYGIRTIAEGARAIPVISSGISYLGSEAPHVMAACIAEGWFDFAGYGRETLAYPEVARTICAGEALDSNKLCLTCGKCTEIMRVPGGTPGCALRDPEVYLPLYRRLVWNK